MAKQRLVDVLVIGSGAGGGVLAFRLAQKGVNVMVLEKGDWCERNEAVEDEFAQHHLEMYRPSGETDPTVVRSKGEVVAENSRIGQAFYLVGGGTVRYSATSWRYRPQDFSKLTTYGPVAGTTLSDWPLTYEELEPYYTEVEKEIGVSGKAGADPTEPPRSKDVLMPPLKEDRFQRRIVNAAKKLGWRPFPIPTAIHSQRNEYTDGRDCMQCGWCSGYPCLFQAKSSVDVVIFPRAQKTNHFTLKTNAYVTLILTHKNGKVRGVEYIDLMTGKNQVIECKALVLATSAIQTARLLLHSGTKGLANSSGLIGRNLMFHIEAKASALFPESYNQGLYKKVGIHDFYFPKKEDGFINHRSIQSGSKATPIAFALGAKGFGKNYVETMRDRFLRTHELQCMAEDLPQFENRVGLSSEKKDPWGVPVPEISHVYHESDKKAVASTLEKIRLLLEAAGGTEVQLPKVHDNITGRYTWHLMGTTRMGKDPAVSVLNRDCQSHDISNLFVADGSGFPTSGGINPTLTIQALALRAADRLLALTKEGKVG